MSGAIPCLNSDNLESLFTGLGFVGLIAAFWHERDVAADADREHAELLTAMRIQAQVGGRQAHILSLSAHIPILDSRIAELTGKPLVDTQQAKLKELRAARDRHRQTLAKVVNHPIVPNFGADLDAAPDEQ